MADAAWRDGAAKTVIDWKMSATLEDVPCGDRKLAQRMSLDTAVCEWARLSREDRHAAVLTLARPVQVDGLDHIAFAGEAIALLADLLTTRE